jgi:hypothetical protein
MKKLLFILLLIPLISVCQSGISLSGSSNFSTNQSLIIDANNVFSTTPVEIRNNELSLSIFRGRKFRIGTIALNASVSYSISKTNYTEEMALEDYEIIKKSIIPSVELWYILLQTKTIFLYTSIGAYGILEDLNLFSANNEQNTLNYNALIPFVRSGLQINYGKLFINPFISFDLDKIKFDEFNEFLDTDFKQLIKDYSIRTGVKFGIMF